MIIGAVIGTYVWYGSSDDTGSGQADLDKLNRILVLQGEPTLAPGSDPSKGRPVSTEPSASPPPPGPSPTARPPLCGGGAITGGQEIVDTHGETKGCSVYGTQLVFTTNGAPGGNGGIGTFQCELDDESCLGRNAPKTPGSWSFFVAPRPGVVKVLAWLPPDGLVINNGAAQMCFNLTTHEYESSASETCN